MSDGFKTKEVVTEYFEETDTNRVIKVVTKTTKWFKDGCNTDTTGRTCDIALAISTYYSIIGLIAIFSAAVIPIAVMGVVLESGKLVTAAWVYHNWKRTPKLLKGYLISAVVILMFITSMGIFGFLSKAHIEQTTVNSDNTLQIELIESQIQRERGSIERAENTLAQLDNALEKYVELGAVTKGLNARKEQETERNELNATITKSTETISSLTQKMSELNIERIAIEAEVAQSSTSQNFSTEKARQEYLRMRSEESSSS